MLERFPKRDMRWLSMAQIRFNPNSPVIVLEVTLESMVAKRRMKMAVDTGATYTMIPWEIAEALGYRPDISSQRITLVTASGVERVPLIKVDIIRILGKEIRDIEIVCHDLPARSYVDGLLGPRSLRELKAKIDFDKGTLEI